VAGEKSHYQDKGGKWPIHVNPDDIRHVYFFSTKDHQWHALQWTQAKAWDGPMNEDGLQFARSLVRRKHRYFDDKLALAELLERRNLSQGHTMAERRAALRLCREQSTLGIDATAPTAVADLSSVKKVFGAQGPGLDDEGGVPTDFTDDLDDDPHIDDGHFYDEVLEDV
jgi:hypothetical protein